MELKGHYWDNCLKCTIGEFEDKEGNKLKIRWGVIQKIALAVFKSDA